MEVVSRKWKALANWQIQNGKQKGLWKRYYPNGKPYDEGNYVDGKKTGLWKNYDATGNLIRSKTY